MSALYRRTIEGWHLVGNHAGAMPVPEQSAAWDLLPDSEWERIGALFDATLPDTGPLDALPGERGYDEWKRDRVERNRVERERLMLMPA